MSKMKKIVCCGGGGIAESILVPLKKLGANIVAITSMVDNGGSSGALRSEFDVLPPGDIRRHLLALSEAEDWQKKLWDFRFAKEIEMSPGHFGHNFANVFIGGLEHLLGDFEKALAIAGNFLKIRGQALPATLDRVQLVAELENGSSIKGEDEIDAGENHDRNLKIKRIYLEPKGRAYQPAIREIETADIVIVGPGDLYSSLLPCFLAEGMKEAIGRSKAEKIFICPAMTKLGETQGYTVEDFADKVEEYLGVNLSLVVYNNNMPEASRVRAFKEKKEKDFVLDPLVGNDSLSLDKFIGRDLILDEGEIKFNQTKLTNLLKEICKL